MPDADQGGEDASGPEEERNSAGPASSSIAGGAGRTPVPRRDDVYALSAGTQLALRWQKKPVCYVLTLLVWGLRCGPRQHAHAELALEVTYPRGETPVGSVPQSGGNLVSMVLVPVAGAASRLDREVFPTITVLDSDIRVDVVLLMGLAAATYDFYTGFDSPLLRTAADNNAEGGGCWKARWWRWR